MSLNIEIYSVKAVLLEDGWHTVANRSFDLDTYEFHHEKETLVSGGQVKGLASTGAAWTEEDGTRVACPLTSVLAVRTASGK